MGSEFVSAKVRHPAFLTMEAKQEYTVDDAIEKLGFGPFQTMIFFFCGFLWLADAMELMILSILSPAVKCQWDLSSAEEAIITSVVFVGALIGSVFWGFVGDTYGRKKALVGMDIVVVVSGVLSALKLTANDDRIPGYPWLLLCRFGVGFGAAGITQVSTYYIEFLPRRTRAICTVSVSGWWAVGTMFGAGLAVGVMGHDKLGWHWYLGLSATPMALVLLFIPFVPESARFCLVKGKTKQAVNVLNRVAWFNRRSLPKGNLVSQESKHDGSGIHGGKGFSVGYTKENSEEKQPLVHSEALETQKASSSSKFIFQLKDIVERFPLLFANGMWKVTAILSVLWFGSAWLYYGNVLLTTTIFQYNPHCGVNASAYNGTNDTFCEEKQLDTYDYLRIMYTAGAELPGLLVTLVVIEIVGRKLTMALNFTIVLIGFCLLFICTGEGLLTFFLFLIRAFTTGVFQTMYVYTPEVYATKVRGVGIGFLYSVARVGAILTPYVAQVLFETNDYATISLYAFSSFVLIIHALLLPIETKGKALRDEK